MVVVWGRSLVQKISEGDQDGCRDGLEGGFSYIGGVDGGGCTGAADG